MDKKVMIYQLLSIRSAVDAMLQILTDPQPTTEEPPECQHPEESRISMARMGHPNHWKCRDCGFENDG